MSHSDPLSRRERQIMDVVYQRGAITANQLLTLMPDPPSSSAIRTLLRILEEKGHLRHRRDGVRFIYTPTRPQKDAAQHALTHLVKTFFGGSVEKVVSALVSESDGRLSDDELDRLSELIERARSEEK